MVLARDPLGFGPGNAAHFSLALAYLAQSEGGQGFLSEPGMVNGQSNGILIEQVPFDFCGNVFYSNYRRSGKEQDHERKG